MKLTNNNFLYKIKYIYNKIYKIYSLHRVLQLYSYIIRVMLNSVLGALVKHSKKSRNKTQSYC
jgi:hypothetical protein